MKFGKYQKLFVFTAVFSFVGASMGWAAEDSNLAWMSLLLSQDQLEDGYGTVSSAGQIWMDRNLGASRVAISSDDSEAYGDLYQWGRGTDGHEKRISPTTTTLSSADNPGHGRFISNSNTPDDWRVPQNDNLWQGTSGINNPCPSGFRLPTSTELDAERASWSSNDYADSPLKLVVAGYRNGNDGSLGDAGSAGHYWSSTVNGSNSRYLYFNSSSSAIMGSYIRAGGFSVRCFKD